MHAAYVAGLLDTEGSIMLAVQSAGKPRAPQINITMGAREPLDAVAGAYGGFVKVKHPRTPNHSQQYEWRAHGSAALGVLGSIRPFLVIERRQRLADILLDEYPRKGRGRERHYRIERLFSKMRRLNKERERMPHGYNTKRDKVQTKKPKVEDFAYFVGVLDGQGRIATKDRVSPGPVIEVTSTDPELVAWLREHFGGSMHRQGPAKVGKRAAFSWRLGKREAVPLLGLVGKHLLVPAKRERALEWVA